MVAGTIDKLEKGLATRNHSIEPSVSRPTSQKCKECAHVDILRLQFASGLVRCCVSSILGEADLQLKTVRLEKLSETGKLVLERSEWILIKEV